MNIVIIGTGNTATILGRKLKEAGHEIVQVFGRNAQDASELAYILNTESTNYWSVINKDADIYILAVSDLAIEDVVKELALPKKPIVHTAASVSKQVLSSAEHYGVFYPLQSLRKEATHMPDIPVIIDASDEETFHLLDRLALTISANIAHANDDERAKLHLAAVFCNNFVNHIYTITEQYCRKEGVDFTLLYPLIQETAQRLTSMKPAEAQTGPALRNDKQTIEKHLKLLQPYPDLKNFYISFTQSIQAAQIW